MTASFDPDKHLQADDNGFYAMFGLRKMLSKLGPEEFSSRLLCGVPALVPFDQEDDTKRSYILSHLGEDVPGMPKAGGPVSGALGSGWKKLFRTHLAPNPIATPNPADTVGEDESNRRWFEQGEADNTEILYQYSTAFLTKRAGTPYPKMITIGRSTMCDLVLLFSTVSKLHAHLEGGGTSWTLVNQQPRNGTYLNREGLQANSPHELKDGDLLQFGQSTPLMLLMPESYVGFLESFKFR